MDDVLLGLTEAATSAMRTKKLRKWSSLSFLLQTEHVLSRAIGRKGEIQEERFLIQSYCVHFNISSKVNMEQSKKTSLKGCRSTATRRDSRPGRTRSSRI